MKKQKYAVGVAVLLAALLAFAGVAQSAMWVGAELGANFPTGTLQATGPGGGSGSTSASFAANVIGGAMIGYDFVNTGFGGYNWPEWAKYFSVAMDITYNRLTLNHIGGVGIPNVDGYCVAYTFMVMAHYGFFPDSVVPTGRVNPYIGVGPGVVWTGLHVGHGSGIGDLNATNIALVVEPGIRWMAFPNVSIDTAFRWRLADPSYDVQGVTLKFNPLNQFTALVRANYHF
jgi:hypothetical protein